MAPSLPLASLELDHPLYAVQFDPEDATRLAVGGGGGSGHSGVGNKLTILDASTKDELRSAGELVFPADQDSVMSLAFGPRKGKTTYVYAGVNASAADVATKGGRNESLRCVAVETSRARSSSGAKGPETKMAETVRAAVFTDEDPAAYQRVVRVAPGGGLAVAASALGKAPQLAVFEPAMPAPRIRGVLELPRDAEDVDVMQTAEGVFQVAYCYKNELFVLDVGKEAAAEPRLVFIMEDNNGNRPMFRSIRYLSSTFILTVSNLPGRSGVVLHVIRLPSDDDKKGRMAAAAMIQKKMSATGLAVANLAPPPTPFAPLGDTQFVIAVAGSDSSIYTYTMTHQTARSIDLVRELHPLRTLKQVHGESSITGLSFSHFITPKTHLRPQFIKLASTGMQKTVVVHNIPLKKYISPAPRNRKAPPPPARYVVDLPSQTSPSTWLLLALTVLVCVLGVVYQGYREMYGQGEPVLGVYRFLPSWHGTLRSFDPPPVAFLQDDFFAKLAGGREPTAGETLVLWDRQPTQTDTGEATAAAAALPNLDVHDAAVHGPGKTWEELGEEQKEAWKARLLEVGAWTQGMGESVFKGILFGEIAGAVGRAVAG